jgi:hypothetical protein
MYTYKTSLSSQFHQQIPNLDPNTDDITKSDNQSPQHNQPNPSNPTSHIMKLLPTTALFLTSLFTTTTLAGLSVGFEAPLPSSVGVGSSYEVKWTANQDYVSHAHTHHECFQP